MTSEKWDVPKAEVTGQGLGKKNGNPKLRVKATSLASLCNTPEGD
jgi:hypothetical protein